MSAVSLHYSKQTGQVLSIMSPAVRPLGRDGP